MVRVVCYFCIVLATFFWGSAFHASKVSVAALPPFTAAALRFGLAALILMVLSLGAERRTWAQARRQKGTLAVLGVFGITGFCGFLFWGLTRTSAINASMIMGTNPIMVMLLARIIYGDPISRRQKVGAALGMLGVVAVVAGSSWSSLLHLQLSSGDGLVLLANLSWATYTVLTRKVRGVSPLVLTTASTSVGALGLLVVASQEHSWAAVRAADGQVWAAIGYLAVFGSVLAFLFWNWGIALLGAQRTSIFFNLVPVFAVLVALCLGNAVAASQLVGGCLVIAGVLTATGMLRLRLS